MSDETDDRQERPCGSWPTPLTADRVLADAVRLIDARPDGDAVLWAEGRPAQAGRVQLVRRGPVGSGSPEGPDGAPREVLPDGFAARTSVHEYGGGSWLVRDGVVWFSQWSDQRLYRLDPGAATPVPVTPEPEVPRGDRFADADLHPDGTVLVAVREHHPRDGGGAVDVRNEIVRFPAAAPEDGPGAGAVEVLVSGPDFVASPRFSPDGGRLAYVRWDHPSMPWDDTELVVREVVSGAETVVAGGPGESVQEPRWAPDGRLLFLSDRTDRWNLYAWTPGAGVEPVLVLDAEIGVPAWLFGSARYAPLPDGRIVAAARAGGSDRLVVRDPDGAVRTLELPFTELPLVRAAGDDVLLIAGSPHREAGLYRLGAAGLRPGAEPAEALTTLSAPRDPGVDPGFLSVPEHLGFASGERTAHALFYPPASATHRPTEGELPPLLVVIHGGPTACATHQLNLGVQFWTSRGFAVVDVDYGGSTGYGRAYRDQLRGAWGVVDVADCLAAARALADAGRVDPARMCIRGGSAGGYTTLAALARPDTPFAAGADHFGVADLEVLARDTHKFESRYLDVLVGPYPQQRDVYRERSPLSHVEDFRRPLIVLQGSEDAVVPPKQSELIVEALRERRVPVAYLLFDGEQHGFRQAANIRRAMEAELSFYAQVLGFPLPAEEGIEPVAVENLPPPS